LVCVQAAGVLWTLLSADLVFRFICRVEFCNSENGKNRLNSCPHRHFMMTVGTTKTHQRPGNVHGRRKTDEFDGVG
jgi:hypothetical protein